MIGAACGMAGEAGRAATREARVTDRRGDGAGERPAPGPESRKPAPAEPSAAERRARALRDNLHRRKSQARARKAGPDGESPPET